MMRFKFSAALAFALLSNAVMAQDIKPNPVTEPAADTKSGSFYLQCDGNPNNMSAGEGLARFVGAVTLLGIFVPSVESPSPEKRKFGTEGVAACTKLIDGDKAETNLLRRLPLILGRALHQIEAKNNAGALTDVAKARAEAKAGNLLGDPYFDRSMGVSFDLIESLALIRSGDVAAASEASMRPVRRAPMSYYSLIGANDYIDFNRTAPPAAIERWQRLAKISFVKAAGLADRYTRNGDYEAAAATWSSLNVAMRSFLPEASNALRTAQKSVALALAGKAEAASESARQARATITELADSGKPDEQAPNVVEMIDFHEIIRLAKNGKANEARVRFASRSEWTAPGQGEIMAVLDLLRVNAPANELTGPLAKTPDDMWRENRDRALAMMLERDKNNKFLWAHILPYAKATDYEALSKAVWNGTKSRWLAKQKVKDSEFFAVTAYDAGALTQVDAMLLHCAITGKARGYNGMLFLSIPERPSVAFVRFGNAGDQQIDPLFFLDADAVIASLRDVIPPPEEVATRQRARAATAKK